MRPDPIVSEVSQVRESQAASFRHDLKAIFDALKAQEQQHDRRKVSFPPRQVIPLTQSEPVARA